MVSCACILNIDSMNSLRMRSIEVEAEILYQKDAALMEEHRFALGSQDLVV